MAAGRFPEKIVSGGQTGVDRAALDTALEMGIPGGGWAPRGRRAEDGVIPGRYPLTETETTDTNERTKLNVRDSDATLIIARGPLTGGTGRTCDLAQALGRPCLVVDLAGAPDPGAAADWLARERPRVLNVAGPRESTAPGIHRQASEFLKAVLEHRGRR